MPVAHVTSMSTCPAFLFGEHQMQHTQVVSEAHIALPLTKFVVLCYFCLQHKGDELHQMSRWGPSFALNLWFCKVLKGLWVLYKNARMVLVINPRLLWCKRRERLQNPHFWVRERVLCSLRFKISLIQIYGDCNPEHRTRVKNPH